MRYNKKKLFEITCPFCKIQFYLDNAAGVATCPHCFLELEVGVPMEQHYMERGNSGIPPRRPSSRRRVMRRGALNWDE